MEKYYNDAIIGNTNIVASFTKYGELLRMYYPNRDYKQVINFFHMGLKINDSNIIYLHKDINNLYEQYSPIKEKCCVYHILIRIIDSI